MKKFIKENIILFIPLLILTIISIFNMHNAKYISDVYNIALFKQCIWFSLGYLILFIVQKFNLKNIFKYAKYFYAFTVFLLILVLFVGADTNGAKCWFNIFGISFQPSELAKMALAMYLVNIVSNTKIKNLKGCFI